MSNQDKSIEHLLKARYKVIAGYPNSQWTIDHVFYPCLDEAGWYDKFPHLFRKLEWWEERKPEEMPKYVKQTGMVDSFNNPVPDWFLKVRKHFNAGNGEWRDDSYNTFCAEPDNRTIGVCMSYSSFEPATESEYLNYINKKP